MILMPISRLFCCGVGIVLQKGFRFIFNIAAEIQEIPCVDKCHKSEGNVRKLPEYAGFAYCTKERYGRKEEKIEFLNSSVLCEIGERRFAVI